MSLNQIVCVEWPCRIRLSFSCFLLETFLLVIASSKLPEFVPYRKRLSGPGTARLYNNAPYAVSHDRSSLFSLSPRTCSCRKVFYRIDGIGGCHIVTQVTA
ncbi:hypothetical protein B0J14DRAFT_55293 [Halenospora varia]|nr:hypothetical protein B0J14DRAFT_55293 [Halenospora varia]